MATGFVLSVHLNGVWITKMIKRSIKVHPHLLSQCPCAVNIAFGVILPQLFQLIYYSKLKLKEMNKNLSFILAKVDDVKLVGYHVKQRF